MVERERTGVEEFFPSDYHYNLAVSQKSAGQLEAALRTARLAAILARDKAETHDILALRAEIEAMLEIQDRGK